MCEPTIAATPTAMRLTQAALEIACGITNSRELSVVPALASQPSAAQSGEPNPTIKRTQALASGPD